MSQILSSEPFVPHTLEHLTKARVFPSALPEDAYNKMLAEYEAVHDVTTSRITYSSDGLKVTGIMAAPVNLLHEAHPILIYNRGGSREYGKLTLLSAMRSMVPFAKKGYLVFASNYRGNDGGEGQEEFGGNELNDIFNLLDIAKSHPAFDGRNVYMLGHSRGGMMTYLAMRRGVKINAAISIAGIADARVMVQSPLMVEHVMVPLIPHYKERGGQALIDRSALCWPQDLKQPLLLLHGTGDKDVPYSQSVELAEKLRELDRTCSLHLYEGGSHALIRFWDDVLARCNEWMERFKA